MHPQQQPPYLSVRALARELDVSERTVYRLIHDGRVRAVRFGALIRIPRSELDHLPPIVRPERALNGVDRDG